MDCIATEFFNITESFNFKLHISCAIHMGGHTLDLVSTLGLDVDLSSCEGLLIRDHKFIFLDLSLQMLTVWLLIGNSVSILLRDLLISCLSTLIL